MKKEISIFEQIGGTYTEVDGIFYPNLVVKPEKNVVIGKYGTIWMRFMEEKYSMRYLELHLDGKLRAKAAEVNEEAMEVSRSGSFIFFDDLASQRYYLPISSPPHREEPIRSFSRETDVGNMF